MSALLLTCHQCNTPFDVYAGGCLQCFHPEVRAARAQRPRLYPYVVGLMEGAYSIDMEGREAIHLPMRPDVHLLAHHIRIVTVEVFS